MLEKNIREKVQKKVFYINTYIVSKKWGGGKTRETILPATPE